MQANLSRAYEINLVLSEVELHEIIMELEQNINSENCEMLVELYNVLMNAIERSKGTELL